MRTLLIIFLSPALLLLGIAATPFIFTLAPLVLVVWAALKLGQLALRAVSNRAFAHITPTPTGAQQ